MSRRENGEHRCARCRMLGDLCICALIPSPAIATRTQLILIIHRYEDRKSTNTGRLATECLANSAVVVRGDESRAEPRVPVNEGNIPVILFPHEDATPLPLLPRTDAPVTLIVPDGNWRQASKVRNRVPGMRDARCVSLPIAEPSVYRLRAEAHEKGLATMEAIARAFGILEGRSVEAALLEVFRVMVSRTLWSRGVVPASAVLGGVPEGARRHDPKRKGSAP